MTTAPSTGPTGTLTDALGRCAYAVTAYFGALFGSLEGIADRVSTEFADGRPVAAAALNDVVEQLAFAALAAHPVVGAGFVARQGWLSDRDLHLAWWQGEEKQPLAERGVPIGHHVFDYTRHEWFETPRATGARHVTGPYVDYVCTDDYTVTITTPVTVGGQLLGVVGMDVLVDRLERELLPLLRAAGLPIAVVNASGRIVTATDSRREPGSMLRLEGLDDALAPLRGPEPVSQSRVLPGGAEVIACGDTSLALVVGL